MRCRSAFTLIELLVVIAIIATLSGLIVLNRGEDSERKLDKAARELALTLDRARMLALRSAKAHAVTFHVENAGDGSVLRNFSDNDGDDFPGRHWYAIIGPDRTNSLNATMPPPAWTYQERYSYPFIGQYEEAMEKAQVDSRVYLPRGVRFLALSDAEANDNVAAVGYPRPWHGWYDPVSKRILAWGGYDRSSGLGGLAYQGADDAIPYDERRDTNLHPAGVWGQISATASARNPAEDGLHVDMSEQDMLRYMEVALPVAIAPNILKEESNGTFKRNGSVAAVRRGPDTSVYPGTVRPLVNGYWGDVMLAFDIDGRCLNLSGAARTVWFNGSRDDMGLVHDVAASGGYAITLTRDVDTLDHLGGQPIYEPDPISGELRYDRVSSQAAYHHTIYPFVRVCVPREVGDCDIRHPDHPQASLPTSLELP